MGYETPHNDPAFAAFLGKVVEGAPQRCARCHHLIDPDPGPWELHVMHTEKGDVLLHKTCYTTRGHRLAAQETFPGTFPLGQEPQEAQREPAPQTQEEPETV